jgi:predicted small secreted protein
MSFNRWIVAFILSFAFLAGCNTMKGVGEDVEAGGRAVGDAAEDVEDEID